MITEALRIRSCRGVKVWPGGVVSASFSIGFR
jgi:hypothetical protein